jgi:hypothetical protein
MAVREAVRAVLVLWLVAIVSGNCTGFFLCDAGMCSSARSRASRGAAHATTLSVQKPTQGVIGTERKAEATTLLPR